MMKIVHVASFAPNSFGLYEAARDMVKADVMSGHDVYFVDSGANINNKMEYAKKGTKDERNGFCLTVSEPIELDTADIIIVHSRPKVEWLSRNQAPIIYMLHDRPLYSYNLDDAQQKSYFNTYNYINQPRVKKFVYFWPEFKPFWNILPQNKQALLNYPPIDNVRFSPEGKKHVIEDKNKGEFNILICDSWGREINVFEIVNGAMQYARENKNVKFHIYDIQIPLTHNVDLLLTKFKELGCCGELCGRMFNMEEVYRSMDVILTPHTITTRVIGEALSCGVPVIASNKCSLGQFHCDPHNPYDVARAIKEFTNSDQKQNRLNALEQSKNLYLENYSKEMNKIYNEILEGE